MTAQHVLLLTVLLWGSTFAITRDLLQGVPPLVYLWVRFLSGGLLLTLWVRARRGGAVELGLSRSALLLGLLQGGGLLLQVLGQVYTTASKSAFLTALCVPLTPIFGLLLRGDRPRAQQVIAVSIGAAGLLLLTYPASGLSWNPGDLLTLGAALLFAVAIVETTHRARDRDALALAAVQTLVCAALFLLGWVLVRLVPALWPAELVRLEGRPLLWSGKVLIQWVYMAVVCTALTFGMQTWALGRMSAIESAVIFAVEPVVAMIVALLVHGGDEWPGTRGAIGAAMVLCAVLGAEVPVSRLRRGGKKAGAGALIVSLALCLSPSRAAAAPWEGRVSVGGEINADPHGIVDLGLRKGSLSIQIYTDTLDVRWSVERPWGRYSIGARGEALAAGLLISPWRNGAPDPGSALLASYGGVDGAWVRYLPRSFYVGIFGQTRVYFFNALASTVIPVPAPTWQTTVEAVVGRYTPSLHVYARVGANAQLGRVSPHLQVEGVYRPGGALVPRLELRAGWAHNQDFLIRTRLGGLNPYVVPLGGAAWAEWWVENYAALRLGPSARFWQVEISALLDVAFFDGQVATGLSLLGRWRYRRLFADLAVGYAPGITRQEGVSRASLYFLVGADWGRFWRL